MTLRMACYKFFIYRADPVPCERWVRERGGFWRGDPQAGWISFYLPPQHMAAFEHLFGQYSQRSRNDDW